MSGWWYNDYTPAPPREVRGGIKASGKGGFAKKWWGKRWLEVLESFGIGARLSRGRAYAKKGQVADLSIGTGLIRASVQGTRVKPYTITIQLAPYSAAQWDEIFGAVAEHPVVAARLLAGEMPEEMEELCAKRKLPLFPKRQGDMVTECSCPDWSNPCKHIAAVFFVMAEAFDGDPFLLLRLRGMDRDVFISRIAPGASEEEHEEEIRAEPLPAEPSRFWGPEGDIPEIRIPASLPKVHAALPGRLGPLPFWRGKETFPETMAALYETSACRAEEIHHTLEENGGTQ